MTISYDKRTLEETYGVKLNPTIDLAQSLRLKNLLPGIKYPSLQKIVAKLLSKNLRKDLQKSSDWWEPEGVSLSESQVCYSAADVIAGYSCYMIGLNALDRTGVPLTVELSVIGLMVNVIPSSGVDRADQKPLASVRLVVNPNEPRKSWNRTPINPLVHVFAVIEETFVDSALLPYKIIGNFLSNLTSRLLCCYF
jgi:hypothetical protein